MDKFYENLSFSREAVCLDSQCDQMARLFVQYLAIFDSDYLSMVKNCQIKFTIFAEY